MPRFLTGRRLKLLYVLALFQLVAGPLVIFQVTVLCKLTVKEARRHGVASAFVDTLRSDEFRTVVQDAPGVGKNDGKAPSPTSDPKGKLPELKSGVPNWRTFASIAPPCIGRTVYMDWTRRWTPIWPQAPPGPPPRIG